MKTLPNWQHQHVLPGSLDEVLKSTLDDACEYNSSVVQFELSKTFSHIYRLLMPKLNATKVTLGFKTAAQTPTKLVADEFAIAKILILVINQFIEQAPPGKITINVEQQQSDIQLTFSTTEDFATQPLLDSLPNTAKLAQHLGYHLTAQEQNLCLSFPINSATEQPINKLKFLIVEDNDVNATLLAHFLSTYDADIHRVENGKEGVDFVFNHYVDIVFMDINMPVMDGHEATIQIRANKQIEQPTILAVTANTTAQSRSQCVTSGMDAFIAKPFTTAYLNEVIQKYL